MARHITLSLLLLSLACQYIHCIFPFGQVINYNENEYLLDPSLRNLNFSHFKFEKAKGNHSDCYALMKAGYKRNGIYNITLDRNSPARPVICYFSNYKAYTVIQARVNGRESFNRRLSEYADGFGNVSADHWIGLNTIRRFVELGNNQLQILLTSWQQQTASAFYSQFSIGTAAQGWPLQVSGFQGNVGDDLSYNNGRVFYTSDVPDPNRCAVEQRGGWWYNYCTYAFLNGYYYPNGRYTPPGKFYDGIYWRDWLGFDYSLMQVSMAVTHG